MLEYFSLPWFSISSSVICSTDSTPMLICISNGLIWSMLDFISLIILQIPIFIIKTVWCVPDDEVSRNLDFASIQRIKKDKARNYMCFYYPLHWIMRSRGRWLGICRATFLSIFIPSLKVPWHDQPPKFFLLSTRQNAFHLIVPPSPATPYS